MNTPFTVKYWKLVESVKHLGVTIKSHLRWNQHISNIRTKGNQTRLPAKKSQNSLSRPEIDRLQGLSPAQCGIPSSTVWDPYTKQNKDRVEMVQRRAARYVLNCYERTASVTEMLKQLD